VLRTALGRTPHTAALLSGAIASSWLRLEFADIPVISRAFAPMVRAQVFDLCEMAVATYLQARAFGSDLVLLPVGLAARGQHTSLLCPATATLRGPRDLAGARIGVRAYSQTTGMWLRGILAESFGLAPEQMRWITFEEAHVAEVRDPPWAKRAPPGADMLAMLHAGALDAVILGHEGPQDARLRPVIAEPEAAAADFRARHGFDPVNHVLTLRRAVADSHPELVAELLTLFAAARASVRDTAPPFGVTALQPVLMLAQEYMAAQAMLPRLLDGRELWDGLPV